MPVKSPYFPWYSNDDFSYSLSLVTTFDKEVSDALSRCKLELIEGLKVHYYWASVPEISFLSPLTYVQRRPFSIVGYIFFLVRHSFLQFDITSWRIVASTYTVLFQESLPRHPHCYIQVSKSVMHVHAIGKIMMLLTATLPNLSFPV